MKIRHCSEWIKNSYYEPLIGPSSVDNVSVAKPGIYNIMFEVPTTHDDVHFTSVGFPYVYTALNAIQLYFPVIACASEACQDIRPTLSLGYFTMH